MKTKQITYLLLACIVVLVTACNWPTSSSDDDITLDCSGDNGQINRDIAVGMVRQYEAIRNSTVNDDTIVYRDTSDTIVNFNHSTEVFFKLEDMKCFIEHVESYDGNYDNLGIRAYLAASNDQNGTLTSTIIFVPAGTTAGNRSSDIPNIPGGNVLNHGTAGMPPSGNQITNP
ncbi:hypothetical protein FNJ87_05170 [Nonlabens mediterrranea]|uniref:Lipoprotein n=1 Tax=Nonlabens mediterrranea TaxID=1419947 RepID=A0ABS0A318_9FLAO|nr:hypothetical protein BBFL7_02237 [Flavobacteria bacterium BBFL7]MBF4983746.1 hypothetical protein [Nonlabens mediterrranea]